MKKTKKTISIILAVVLVLSVATTALIATANAKETVITLSADKTQLSAGESATVSVKVTANYPVATMSIPVFYDKTLVTVSDATATLSGYAVDSAITDAQSVDSDKIYANTGISADDFGFVLVNYIGGAGENVPETMDSVVFTFKITAKADVTGTAVAKCVSESAKTDDNIAGMLYFGSTTNGDAIDSIPENIENIDLTNATESVVITNGAPELKAIDGTTGVVDNVNKYVYGITIGENVEDFFTVANGTIKVVANDSGKTNGTGAIVQVLDSANNVVDTYTVVIFGDVDGNGEVDGTDSSFIMQQVAGTSELDTVAGFAADVDGNGEADGTDSSFIMQVVAGTNSITTNPYA